MHHCERCNKTATVHLTEISGGKPHDKHLCDNCAAELGFVQQSHVPINELLNQFLKTQAAMPDAQANSCMECGLTWQEFKDTGLLGCEGDYLLFEKQLEGVINRAQQGATHHTGKLPHGQKKPGGKRGQTSDAVKLRQSEIGRLKKELARAVEDESYELAAKLRDQLRALEDQRNA
jgi:protein arginine kinase activator